MNFGLALMSVDCKTPPVNSIKDIVEKIQEAAEEKSEEEWIVGRGYDDFKLSEKRPPNRRDKQFNYYNKTQRTGNYAYPTTNFSFW
jgi:predicted amidohydrolase YtcJ